MKIDEYFRTIEEIYNRVFNEIQKITESDIQNLKKIMTISKTDLTTEKVDEDSLIRLLELKNSCLILLKHLVENRVELPDEIFDVMLEFLYKPTFIDDHSVLLVRKAQIERDIFNKIISILYSTMYVNEKFTTFISGKLIPDEFSVNLVFLINSPTKSYELNILRNLVIEPALVEIIDKFKKSLRNEVKRLIIADIKRKLAEVKDQNHKKIIYKIYYLINNQIDYELMEQEKNEGGEYLGFIYSLILDDRSAEIGFEKIEPYFDQLDLALKKLIQYSNTGEKKLKEEDQLLIEMLLQIFCRLVRTKKIYFHRFVNSFVFVLQIRTSRLIKACIYKILSAILLSSEIYIQKVINCREEVELEMRTNVFVLLPALIRYINAYERRKDLELNLLSKGKLPGSHYLAHQNTTEIYQAKALKSEDPATLMECLNGDVSFVALKLHAYHIRKCCIEDNYVIDKLIKYQLDKKQPIEDQTIINIISNYSSKDFFTYAELFPNFGFYLSKYVLERISEDPKKGLEWLKKIYTREVGDFMIIHNRYFNSLIKSHPWTQELLVSLYLLILDHFPGRVRVIVCSDFSSEDLLVTADTFYLHDTEKYLNREFFLIFSKQLIYSKYYQNSEDFGDFVLKKKHPIDGYSDYIKTKVICGLPYQDDLLFLKRNMMNTDNLVGFLRISTDQKLDDFEVVRQTPMTNFGKKDSQYFLNNFHGSSELDKFLLMFSIDQITPTIETMLKSEIIANLQNKNEYYIEMVILMLFKCRDLDGTIKVLEKNIQPSILLGQLALYNLTIGGKHLSELLYEMADKKSRMRMLILAFTECIWEKSVISEKLSGFEVTSDSDALFLLNETVKNDRF